MPQAPMHLDRCRPHAYSKRDVTQPRRYATDRLSSGCLLIIMLWATMNKFDRKEESNDRGIKCNTN